MIAIIAAMPQDTSEMERRVPHLAVPTPHPGSVASECSACDRPVWLGPDQQELTKQRAENVKATLANSEDNSDDIEYAVVCFICVVALTAMRASVGQDTPIMTAGGDEP